MQISFALSLEIILANPWYSLLSLCWSSASSMPWFLPNCTVHTPRDSRIHLPTLYSLVNVLNAATFARNVLQTNHLSITCNHYDFSTVRYLLHVNFLLSSTSATSSHNSASTCHLTLATICFITQAKPLYTHTSPSASHQNEEWAKWTMNCLLENYAQLRKRIGIFS